MCALAWNAHTDWWPCGFAACACKQVCSFVFHCHRQPLCCHRSAKKMKLVWKNAAVKQLSVRSLPFQTKRSIPAVKKPLRFQLLMHASPNAVFTVWRSSRVLIPNCALNLYFDLTSVSLVFTNFNTLMFTWMNNFKSYTHILNEFPLIFSYPIKWMRN